MNHRTILYRRMPAVLDWYFKTIRGTPNTWMTTPWAILVPPTLWDSGIWKSERCRMTRVHEETHFVEASVWWMARYYCSQQFRYAVELRAMRAEIATLTGAYRVSYAEWCALNLMHDYGITFKPRQVMLAELLA